MNLLEVKKRGRPTISDAELFSDRNHLFWLFDTNWADLGWQLENLKNVNEVATALGALPPDDSHYAVRLLLAPLETAMADQALKSLKRRHKELSKNVEATKGSIAETEKTVESLDRILRHEMKDRERAILICEQRETVERLREYKDRLGSLVKEQKDIRLENARASFARSELVKFCQSERSRLNPRRTANAVAGLPFISWRQSAMRCVKLETNRALGGFRYQIFRVVARIVKSWDRDVKSSHRNVNLVAHARCYLERTRRSPARVYSDLWLNWRYLRLSIVQVVKENSDAGGWAYRISSEYFRLSGAPRSELESFWANRESIKRGKIRVGK